MTTATATAPAEAAPPDPPERPRRRWPPSPGWSAVHLAFALLAYVPLLAVRPGVVTSDTKTYLYLDPGKFVPQVTSMWDPTVAAGTVTHEYIGYLLPMGPWFWGFHLLGVPVWVAQRLWFGTMLFAAAAGVLYLCRTLEVRGPGPVVGAAAYMLTPYTLQYAGRISVILLPWAALPTMVALTVWAVRRGGWRFPALFALVVALVSGINATAIIYVGLAPVLWLVCAAGLWREATWRRVLGCALRMGLLILLCCAWWIAGLQVEAAYGVDVLRYTETVPSTSQTSTAAEVIRGLGYWYFYGSDRLGPWTQSAVLYTQTLWLLALTYLLPVLGFCSAVLVRWRRKAYFVLLVAIGMVLSVGAHPYGDPTAAGGVLKTFMSDSTAGLALRSTDRATPLVVLGLAMLLAAGVSALWARAPVASLVLAALAVAAAVAANPALFNGDAEVASFFHQPASLPTYLQAAAKHLNATHPDTRVLAVPGNDFAAFRWGDTVDTPLPALLSSDRPFITREQQVMGSIATADTLYAMDDPIQHDVEQWNSLAQMARLFSAGDVLVQYDQAWEHYGTPEPSVLASQLATTPAGLSDPVSFGTPRVNKPSYPVVDEEELAQPGPPQATAPLVDYTVTDPRPITRAESDTGAVVVAGDAVGFEDMADAGLLDTSSALYESGTLDTRQAQLHQLLGQGAQLVVTDTNRKEAFRWDTLYANYGETETPSQNVAATDPSDSPIDLAPKAPLSSKTTVSYLGAKSVTASSYGNPVSYTPEDRAAEAVDGNLDTNWETGTFVPTPTGQWWQITYDHPVMGNEITLVQPLTGDTSRWITRATLTFDGGHPLTVDLGPSSRTAAGQVVPIGNRVFTTLRITIDATSHDGEPPPQATAVGFAEVEVAGHPVTEVVDMPTDLLKAAGPASAANRLTLVMTRERVSPYPTRTDPEPTIDRQFTLPTARTFTLTGHASLSALIPDDEIDRLVGRATGGVTAYSSGRLPGSLGSTASAALDGNPSTAWQPGFDTAAQIGAQIHVDLPTTTTLDHLNMQVVADGRHSVPTAMTVSNGTQTDTVALPPITDRRTPGATVPVPVSFPPLTGRDFTFTFTKVRIEKSTNYFSPVPIGLPLGIAELGIPGVTVGPPAATVPSSCRDDLLSIDGTPVWLQITGSSATALANGELPVTLCGPDAGGITLAAGTHVLETVPGHSPTTGWNLDQLVLDSAPGGGPAPAADPTALPATQPGPAPAVTVAQPTRTSQQVHVSGVGGPFELVLGESVNAGWRAVANPGPGAAPGAHPVDLGVSELVDGFANGWPVTAADLRALGVGPGGGFTVTLTWTPQRRVWVALAVTAVALVVCLALAIVPRRRRRRGRHARATSDPAPAADPAPALRAPWARATGRPPAWAVAGAVVVCGGIGVAVASPVVGAAAAVAVAVALLVPRLRVVTAVVAVGMLVAAAANVVAGQALHPRPESSNWPSDYEQAARYVWVAVVFLVTDTAAATVRRRPPADAATGAGPRRPARPGWRGRSRPR